MAGSGQARCWGANVSGQLGADSSFDHQFAPVEVVGLSGVTALAAGRTHTCALTTGGGAHCWGGNGSGQLGDGTTIDRRSPVGVVGLASGAIAIAAGGDQTCAITSGGGARCWGAAGFDESGNPATVEMEPAGLGLFRGVRGLALGMAHGCALLDSQEVRCWGANGSGQVRGGNRGGAADTPVEVAGLGADVRAIVAGDWHTCALLESGEVRCWGTAGSPNGSLTPVDGIGGPVRSLVAGGGRTCAVLDDARVRCWESFGEAPHDVAGLGAEVGDIAIGGAHACHLAPGGGVACWGSNVEGQLGGGPGCLADSADPVPVALAGATTAPPVGVIGHASGPTDVVLRLDRADMTHPHIDPGVFLAGPEFTLYGDGTVILRDERAEGPTDAGPILRGAPFRVARLDPDQIQAVLGFAIGEGALGSACDRYESQLDAGTSLTVTIRTASLDREVVAFGPSPLAPLAERLRTLDRVAALVTTTWQPDRFWGSLYDTEPTLADRGLPPPTAADIVAWPWPALGPADFVPPGDGPGRPFREMTSAEAAVLGLSGNGGVVERVFVAAPDGSRVFVFSLWPMLPDERS